MLFHVTQTHAYETCMAHDKSRKTKFSQTLENAKQLKVSILGVYSDPPGHQIFMILETDSMEKLVKFLDPIIDFGDYNIRPVLDFKTAVKNLTNN